MEEMLKLIGTYGFPMVFCLIFYFDLRKVIKANTLVIKDLRETQLVLINQLNDRARTP